MTVAAVLLLAGCAGPGPSASAGSEPPPASGLSPHADGCTGFELIAPWPGGHPRAHVPQGWDAANPLSSVQVEAWECQRLAWGRFERGPVRILFETHDQGAAPGPCRSTDELTTLAVLQSLWTDDADLAADLAAQGLPARWAPMAAADTAAGAAAVRDWSWGLPGEASRVAVPMPLSAIPGAPLAKRLFWDNGTAVSSMDLAATASPAGQRLDRVNVIPQVVPQATFAAPMLLADRPAPLATAHAFQDGQWAADIHHYGDLRCGTAS